MSRKFPLVEIGILEARGAIVAIQDGNHGELHPKAADYVDCGIPFIMANDLNNGYVALDSCSRIAEIQARRLRIGFSTIGDVLLTHKGTLGNVALVTDADPFIMLTPQVTYYRTDSAHLLNRFLVYAFRDPSFQARMHAVGAQGTRPYIGITAQRRLQITFPPRNTQENIVEKISPYDDLIENNRRRIQLLEESARQLYKEWFTYLRFPGHEHAIKTDGIPEGWQSAPLAAICSDIRDSVKPSQLKHDTPYIGLEHIPRRSITLHEWGFAEEVESNKLRYVEGDILFGKIRPYFHKVGFTLTDGVCSSDAVVIRAHDQDIAPYVLALVSSDQFVAIASKTAKEGSKMPRADWKFMQQHPVLLPSRQVLLSFRDTMLPIMQQLKVLALQNQKLAQARDLLLPRLMNGEVTV